MTIGEFKELDVSYGELMEIRETFTGGQQFTLYFAGESTVSTVLFGTSRHGGEVQGVKPYALSIIDVGRPPTTKTKKSLG
ncbi:MAG: hypothetical protein HY974_03085 [Candidatus Kerfeldbacteria bacterium]|nr:hypothetical protein [Candidatus Kerfeldbacteria bacterium]